MKWHKYQEIEAYQFAMYFLMPEENFIKVADKYTTDGVCDVRKVAEAFKVEPDKAYERGQMIGLWR